MPVATKNWRNIHKYAYGRFLNTYYVQLKDYIDPAYQLEHFTLDHNNYLKEMLDLRYIAANHERWTNYDTIGGKYKTLEMLIRSDDDKKES